MSELQFHCPHCQGLFAVDRSLVGTHVLCPLCSAEVLVPDIDQETMPEPPAPPPAPTAPAEDAVSLSCPVCQGQFLLPRELLGQQVECPHCQTVLDIGGDTTGVTEEKVPGEAAAIDEPVAPPADVSRLPPAYAETPPASEPAEYGPPSGVASEHPTTPSVSQEANVAAVVPASAEPIRKPARAPSPVRRLTPQERAKRKQVRNLIVGGGCLILLWIVYYLLI